MGYQLDKPAGEELYETAAEALAAVTPETTGIWLLNPDTVDGTRTLTRAELADLASQEAAAPDPEELPGPND